MPDLESRLGRLKTAIGTRAYSILDLDSHLRIRTAPSLIPGRCAARNRASARFQGGMDFEILSQVMRAVCGWRKTG